MLETDFVSVLVKACEYERKQQLPGKFTLCGSIDKNATRRNDEKALFLDYLAQILAGTNDALHVTAVALTETCTIFNVYIATNDDSTTEDVSFSDMRSALILWLNEEASSTNITVQRDSLLLDSMLLHCHQRLIEDIFRLVVDVEIAQGSEPAAEFGSLYEECKRFSDSYRYPTDTDDAEMASLMARLRTIVDNAYNFYRLRSPTQCLSRLNELGIPLETTVDARRVWIGVANLCKTHLALGHFKACKQSWLKGKNLTFFIVGDYRVSLPVKACTWIPGETVDTINAGRKKSDKLRRSELQILRGKVNGGNHKHAEMKLLDGFEARDGFLPSELLPYIGCSKLLCYGCAAVIEAQGLFEYHYSHFQVYGK
ncbi:MAG: hypothetical protein MMC23_005351 [Stictis urceolatum]|nr:hypothetical protein [Stictis urceolata]